MPVELIGLIRTDDTSETRPGDAAVIDRQYLRRLARAHEDSDFDRVLVGYTSSLPDNQQVAAYAAAHTERLGYLVAHRPGVVQPTVAARAFATLDQLTDGRIALHAISGSYDVEQRRDGDYLEKADRYARTQEYLQILKRAWTTTEPFSHEGRFYRFDDHLAGVRPRQQPRIPIYFGGSSPDAYRVGGAEADVFALFGQPLAQIAEEIASVRESAAAAGRAEPPRISISLRVILGETEDLAWARAHRILDATQRNRTDGNGIFLSHARLASGTDKVSSAGTDRQLAAARAGERHDRALWTALAAATGAAGNSTALVGTPETVAEALLDYVDIGVSTLLIRGYDPYEDAVDYGRELIPRVREGVARRDAAATEQVAAVAR